MRGSSTSTETSGDTAHHQDRAARVEQLFREHNQALLRFLQVRLQSPQEAKDIAQEAYVRLLKLDTPEVSYLRALLFKTALNLAIDRLRSRGSETRRLEMEFFEEHKVAPDPEKHAIASESLRLLEESLRKLPPKCRQAFLLRKVDGLSSAEISRRMQIPERTVRHYITEAIVYCRSRLERQAALENGR